MADSEPQPPTQTTTVQDEEKGLKYLDFVQIAAIYVLVCLSTVYEFAKENSGPLKPGVQAVEGTVKAVIGPVYEKLHDVPFELLKFVDRKVDQSINEVENCVPSLLKQAPEVARSVVSEVQRYGVVDTVANIANSAYKKYEPTVKELYTEYEPVAEEYAVSAWRSLNKLPLFPQVAQILVPTAAYWSEKYNQLVIAASDRGYTVSLYLPLVPLDRIAKVFEGGDVDVHVDEPIVTSNEEPVAIEQSS
jgi:hypothetical protein